MPSSRAGHPDLAAQRRRSMRDASENSTSASVASASARTVALELSRSTPSSTSGPTSRPNATNTIAGVTGVPDSRREIAATPSSVSATMASDHSIQSPSRRGSMERRLPTSKRLGITHAGDLAARSDGSTSDRGPPDT